MRSYLLILIFLGFAIAPAAQAEARSQQSIQVAQNDGKSLSEAVEQVRRQTNGRIISAETKVKNGREVHHVKVLTKDGKVKTHKVQGRRRGNGNG